MCLDENGGGGGGRCAKEEDFDGCPYRFVVGTWATLTFDRC